MNYPRQIMKKTELEKMGFPEEWLLMIYRLGIRKIAWKMGNAPNSPILYDCEELEKYRKAQCL